MFAPAIPALNDHEMEAVLNAAAGNGARSAGYVLLRLPLEIKDLFREWLETNVPGPRQACDGAGALRCAAARIMTANWNTRMKRNRALCRDDGAPLPHGGEAAGAESAHKPRSPSTSSGARPGLAISSPCSNNGAMPHYIYESRLLKTMAGPICGVDEAGAGRWPGRWWRRP